MLFQIYTQKEKKNLNGQIENNILFNQIYYDKNSVIKCPKCNNLSFYIENKLTHECPNEKETYKVDKYNFMDKSNELKCDINNIDFKCVKHQKEFLYFKDSNYYCSECLKENDFEDYLNLDFITLSKNEIEKFKKIIDDSENILKEINTMTENFIKKIKESYETFLKRNNSLIEYCKGLLKFYEKYEKNFNLISTIRRISKNINNINELSYNNLINFYDRENVIKFNNEFKYTKEEERKKSYCSDDGYFSIEEKEKSYFESENIIKNGEYYLGECINEEAFVFKALSIKDKKLVTIKKLINTDEEEFVNEINILKEKNNCENCIKYLDSFEENNNKFIVTELYDGDLRNLLNFREYGFSIEEIKKIFCQINEGFKYLKSNNLFNIDLKPENILFNVFKNSDDNIYYKYKICDFGDIKSLEKKLSRIKKGSKIYEAPEMIYNNKFTNKSEIFSIGILLYELYYGNPENILTKNEIIENIKNGLKMKENNNDNINDFNDLKNLIEECTKNEENRIEWDDYFNHKFFNYEIELTLEIIEEDLNKNIKLINLELFNNENTELYINNKKEIFKNEFIFNKIGNYNIKLIFNNNIIESSLEGMFFRCENIKNINYKIFNTANVENMNGMFSNCYNLKEINLSLFNTANVEDMSYMFDSCYNLKELNLSSFDTSNVKDMEKMFSNCSNLKELNLSLFDTSNVKNMSNMFDDCLSLKEINLSSFNTSNVEVMEEMFSRCKNLKEINLSSFDTSNVKKMEKMFYICYNLIELNLASFNTSNVKDMKYMFAGCYNLKEINLSSFNTSNVEDMNGMFDGCSSLKEINLSSFDTSKVEEMSKMFYRCSSLKEINLSSFNTSKLEFMNQMFASCYNLKEINLSSFNTSKVSHMNQLFAGCCNLKEINLSSFDISNVQGDEEMFVVCPNLTVIKIKKEFENKFQKIVEYDNVNVLFEFN